MPINDITTRIATAIFDDVLFRPGSALIDIFAEGSRYNMLSREVQPPAEISANTAPQIILNQGTMTFNRDGGNHEVRVSQAFTIDIRTIDTTNQPVNDLVFEVQRAIVVAETTFGLDEVFQVSPYTIDRIISPYSETDESNGYIVVRIAFTVNYSINHADF